MFAAHVCCLFPTRSPKIGRRTGDDARVSRTRGERAITSRSTPPPLHTATHPRPIVVAVVQEEAVQDTTTSGTTTRNAIATHGHVSGRTPVTDSGPGMPCALRLVWDSPPIFLIYVGPARTSSRACPSLSRFLDLLHCWSTTTKILSLAVSCRRRVVDCGVAWCMSAKRPSHCPCLPTEAHIFFSTPT